VLVVVRASLKRHVPGSAQDTPDVLRRVDEYVEIDVTGLCSTRQPMREPRWPQLAASMQAPRSRDSVLLFHKSRDQAKPSNVALAPERMTLNARPGLPYRCKFSVLLPDRLGR
jgi:hypothetical protein